MDTILCHELEIPVRLVLTMLDGIPKVAASHADIPLEAFDFDVFTNHPKKLTERHAKAMEGMTVLAPALHVPSLTNSILTNEERATFACKALDTFVAAKFDPKAPAPKFDESLADLLTDAMHLCDKCDGDFMLMLARAMKNYHAEKEEVAK